MPEALTPSLTWCRERSKPGDVGVHEERRDAAGLLLRVRHREEEADVGGLSAGDEHLLPGDPVGVALAHGPGLLVARVRAGVRLGQGEAAELLAAGEGRQEALLLVLVAELLDRVADERVVDREDDAHVGADPRDLLDHDRVRHHVHPGAAVLGRHGHAGEAELARRAEEVLRELARLVDDGGPRPHDLFGEGADRVPEELLLLGELQIHGRRSIRDTDL